ncbi:MAG TPA: PASTA domain-containing protein [Solirubrobacterales bacterium]|nr:PASTA domain-containing protein [Solirubrobacterales bacterium]
MLVAFFAALATCPTPASADPPTLPTYDGSMDFGLIDGPSDPEEFSWEVHLGEEQELVWIDDRHAAVYYTGREHTAFGISAAPAHDAVGSPVPTSLSVSSGDVVTLIVHHHAGNPAANGAPFVYPIGIGAGWEGGFRTEVVVIPKDEQELKEEQERIARERQEAVEREWEREKAPNGCLVPRLKGRSLKASKKLLGDADCLIGTVRKLKGATGKTGKVVRQDPRPGTQLAPLTAVGVTLHR